LLVYTRPSLRFAHRHRHGTHLRYRKAMSSAAMVFSSTFNCESAMTRPSNSRDTLRLVTRTIPTASGQGSGYPMSRCDRVALPGSWSIFWRLGSRQTDSRTLGKVRAAVVTPVPSCRRGFGTVSIASHSIDAVRLCRRHPLWRRGKRKQKGIPTRRFGCIDFRPTP
jgi:hypothetical protein